MVPEDFAERAMWLARTGRDVVIRVRPPGQRPADIGVVDIPNAGHVYTYIERGQLDARTMSETEVRVVLSDAEPEADIIPFERSYYA